MDLGFSGNVSILPGHDRSACIFLFWHIPAAFSADQSDCHATYRTDNSFGPSNYYAGQYRNMSGLADFFYRDTCRAHEQGSEHYCINVNSYSRTNPDEVHVRNSPSSSYTRHPSRSSREERNSFASSKPTTIQ